MVEIKIINRKAVESAPLNRKSRLVLGVIIVGVLLAVRLHVSEVRGIAQEITAERIEPKPAPTANPCGGRR